MPWRHQMPKHETRNTFLIRKFYEKCGLETSFKPFLIFKESSVKRNLKRPAC